MRRPGFGCNVQRVSATLPTESRWASATGVARAGPAKSMRLALGTAAPPASLSEASKRLLGPILAPPRDFSPRNQGLWDRSPYLQKS